MKTAYRAEIRAAAAQWGLDPLLLEAQVLAESAGHTDAFRFEAGFWDRYLKMKPEWANQNARRVSSSYGLMQIMYPVAKEIGFAGQPEGLFVPEVGLYWGCKKMKQLVDWAGGDMTKALVAYNGGKGSASRQPYPTAPARYAAKIIATKELLDK